MFIGTAFPLGKAFEADIIEFGNAILRRAHLMRDFQIKQKILPNGAVALDAASPLPFLGTGIPEHETLSGILDLHHDTILTLTGIFEIDDIFHGLMNEHGCDHLQPSLLAVPYSQAGMLAHIDADGIVKVIQPTLTAQ